MQIEELKHQWYLDRDDEICIFAALVGRFLESLHVRILFELIYAICKLDFSFSIVDTELLPQFIPMFPVELSFSYRGSVDDVRASADTNNIFGILPVAECYGLCNSYKEVLRVSKEVDSPE